MAIDRQKRRMLKAILLVGISNGAIPVARPEDELSEVEKRKRWAKEKRIAEEREALKVEQFYSTELRHFRMAGHEYAVPANYFGPKYEHDPHAPPESKGFGFFLFLPDYEGYTKDNWRDPFDRRIIKISQVSPVDKDEMTAHTDGSYAKVSPASYGEPEARFRNIRRLLESTPSYHAYDLEGFRRKGGVEDQTTWVGKRSNGEFFFFESSFSPHPNRKSTITNPLCQTQYYSAKEDLFIAYRYSQDHLPKWREIDDRIWGKLHDWRIK